MVDLYCTDAKNKKIHDCSICPESQKRVRKCQQIKLNVFPKEKYSVDNISDYKYRFCPGRATWYEKTVETFRQCLFAYQTGILPREGSLQNQDEFFGAAYPIFVEYYTRKKYRTVWRDVSDFTNEIFKTIGKMFGGK